MYFSTRAEPATIQKMVAQHALTIPEIVTNILRALKDTDSLNGYQGSLARTARCCKSFCDPALNVLWEDLGSLVPLISLLPAVRRVRNKYVVVGTIHPDDFARFDYYAQRVRTLSHVHEPTEFMSKLYAALGQLREELPFPKLQSLTWRSGTQLGYEILLFIPPTLKDLHLSYSSDSTWQRDHSVEIFLYMLAQRGPLIEDFTLNGRIPPFSLNSLKRLKSLRRLNCGAATMDRNLIRSLTTLQHLTELTLSVKDLPHQSLGKNIEFQSLRSLTLVGGSLPLMGEVLHSVYKSPIESLSVYSGSPDSQWSEFKALMESVCTLWSNSLKSLSIHVFISEQDPGSHQIFTSALNVSCLERLYIYTPSMPVYVGDEVLQAMSHSWPDLHALRLPTSHDSSIRGLVHLATGCPNLQALELGRVIVRDLPVPSEVPYARNGLRKLAFAPVDEEGTDTLHLARVLDRLFPGVDVGGQRLSEMGVQAQLRAFQDTRAEYAERASRRRR